MVDAELSLFYFVYFVQDEELARQLVELGYRGSGEVSIKSSSLVVNRLIYQ